MGDIKLSDGNNIPQVGFGVFMIQDYEKCKKAVLDAIACGYRHFDTAQVYQNEKAVGDAIKESGIPREEIFITTKLWCTSFKGEKAKAGIERSLKRMSVDYIDLMLLHRPYSDYINAWKALEDAVCDGKIKSIGISNFNMKQTQEILESGHIKPVVNQVECHPYLQQNEIRKFLKQNDISMEVWYPLGHGDKNLLAEQVFKELGQKYHKSVAQIILRWHIQMGNIILPKSLNKDHMKDNLNLDDFLLSKEDMKQIGNLDKMQSYFNKPEWIDRLMYRFLKD